MKEGSARRQGVPRVGARERARTGARAAGAVAAEDREVVPVVVTHACSLTTLGIDFLTRVARATRQT